MVPRKLILLLLVVAAAPPIGAQVRLAPPDPAADRLVAEALQQAPEIRSAEATIDAAKRRIVPARTLADPFASFTYQNEGRTPTLGSEQGSFAGLMLTQAVPWPGKLDLAGRVAESEALEVAAGTLPRARRVIEARVRSAWYDLVLAKAIDDLIEARRASAAQIEAAARERYSAGMGVQQDVIRAQVELARVDELKIGQRAEIVARTAELNRLLGRAQDAPIDAPSQLPPLAPPPDVQSVIADAIATSPELAAAKRGLEGGNLSVDLARKNFLPDFAINAGSMYRGNFAMGPMWQAGVGMSIPVWSSRRQANQLAEAQARVAAKSADADAIAQQVELRTRERLARLVAAGDVAALYRDKVLPLDELSLESAMASYTAGKVPFVAVAEALNALYGDRAAYQSRLAEEAKWRASIDEASLDEVMR